MFLFLLSSGFFLAGLIIAAFPKPLKALGWFVAVLAIAGIATTVSIALESLEAAFMTMFVAMVSGSYVVPAFLLGFVTTHLVKRLFVPKPSSSTQPKL